MGTKVAFSVSDLDVLKLTDHSSLILVFDRIQSNFGNAYNKNNGIFTCTTSGTYVITWSIEVKENTAVRSYLEKNGQTMSLLSVTSPAISSSSSSQTSILHLTSGDRLYIEALPIASTSGVIVGSSFAAFLLY
ncbi:complement C1q-like protein 2 [Argopecten irradians]|uniref:complement C1q-like protein 2 n=1 Tax=Argopecten irradians TaxID=31199 RepID=UPI0037196581